jgi:putative membrane protein
MVVSGSGLPDFGFAAVLIVIVIAAFWGGLLALILLGIRWLLRQNAADRYRPAPPSEDTALELLRQRYARGEIDGAEYEERRRTLGG